MAFSLCTMDLLILHLISADLPVITGMLGQPLGSLSRGRRDHSWLCSYKVPQKRTQEEGGRGVDLSSLVDLIKGVLPPGSFWSSLEAVLLQ